MVPCVKLQRAGFPSKFSVNLQNGCRPSGGLKLASVGVFTQRNRQMLQVRASFLENPFVKCPPAQPCIKHNSVHVPLAANTC